MENMQYIGNVNKQSTAKDVIGGDYTGGYEKDDASYFSEQGSSMYVQESFDSGVPYVDSLDDVLASNDEFSVASRASSYYLGEVGGAAHDHLRKMTSRDFDEEMKAFESGTDAGTHADYYNEDSRDHYYSDNNSQATDNHSHHSYVVQDIEEEEENESLNISTDDLSTSTPLPERSPSKSPRSPKSPKSGPVYGRSPRKVKFNDDIESHGDDSSHHSNHQSRSMERAMQRFQEIARSPPPLSPSPRKSRRSRRSSSGVVSKGSRNRSVLTPRHEPLQPSPRTPPLRTPPRYKQKSHSPTSSVGSVKSTTRKSPRISPFSPSSNSERKHSPRTSRRMKMGEKIGARVDFLLSAADEQRKRGDRLVPSPKSPVLKKKSPVLTKPEGPRLSTQEKLGVRKYSTSSPVDDIPGGYKKGSPAKKIEKLKEHATFSELKNMYLQDIRYCSPLRDRPIQRTVPKPFSFQTDERAAFKRHITPVVESEANCYKPFKALPMPNYDNDPFFHGPKMWRDKNFTVPEPFKLSHMRMAAKNYRKTRDDIEVGRYRFKALPVPDFSFKTLGLSQQIDLTVPFPFHLCVDERFLNRIRFNGTKRSNMLAHVHITCLLEQHRDKGNELNQVLSNDSSKPSKTSTISSTSTVASLQRRKLEKNYVVSVETEEPRRQFKARPMPKYAKSPPTISPTKKKSPRPTKTDLPARRAQSPASSVRSSLSEATDKSKSPGKRFKAKKMPDFSKPFVPRPKSPGHSIGNNDTPLRNNRKESAPKTRSKSPGHGIRHTKRNPSPAPSVASVGGDSVASSPFRAKKMPNFSKPFVPRTKSPGHSVRSNSNVHTHSKTLVSRTRAKSPGHSISSNRHPSPASSIAGDSVASSPFKAKKMPDFTKPFVPHKGISHKTNRNEKALKSIPQADGPEDLIDVKSQKSAKSFKAKKMPNFSKPFVPKKSSPHPGDHSDQSVSTFATNITVDNASVKSGRSRISQLTRDSGKSSLLEGQDGTNRAFKAKPMPDFNKPFSPSKQERSRSPLVLKKNADTTFKARPLPPAKPFIPEKREKSLSPVVLKKNSHFEARPLPNFSKPFVPLKRSSVEKALVMAVEDKNVLDILDKRLGEYQEKILAGTQKSAPSQDPQSFLKDMTDEVVHKVLQDFVTKAKTAQQNESGQQGGLRDKELGSLDSLTDPSEEFSYPAVADISSDQISSETLSHIGDQPRHSFDDNDLSIGTDNGSVEDDNYLSYSKSEDKDGTGAPTQTEGQVSETAGAKTSNEAVKSVKVTENNDTAKPISPKQQMPSHVESNNKNQDAILPKISNDNSIESFWTKIGIGAKDKVVAGTGPPQMAKNNCPLQPDDMKNARVISIFDDEQSDAGSTVASDNNSLDANERTMPLLQVVDRLNLTMERLSLIEKETEKMINSEKSMPSSKHHDLKRALAQAKEEIRRELKRTDNENAITVIEEKNTNASGGKIRKLTENTSKEVDRKVVQNRNIEEKGWSTRSLLMRDTSSSEGPGSHDDHDIQTSFVKDNHAAHDQCNKVEHTDNNVEMRNPRGDFGDDFGDGSDDFRAGWKRGLEHPDIRVYPEISDHLLKTRVAALSIISEESRTIDPSFDPSRTMEALFEPSETINTSMEEDTPSRGGYPSLSSPDSYDRLLSENVKQIMNEPHDKYAITQYESSSPMHREIHKYELRDDDLDHIEERRMDLDRSDRRVSIYDKIINCCSGKPESPTASELNLMEDDSRDDDGDYQIHR